MTYTQWKAQMMSEAIRDGVKPITLRDVIIDILNRRGVESGAHIRKIIDVIVREQKIEPSSSLRSAVSTILAKDCRSKDPHVIRTGCMTYAIHPNYCVERPKKATPSTTHPSMKDLVERLKMMSPSYASLLAGNPMNRLILSTFNSIDGKHYVTLLFRMVPESSILLINLYYTMSPTDFDITVTAAISQSAATFIKGMDPEMLTT